MSLRDFFKVYLFPFLIVLSGLVVYAFIVIFMDKDNLVLSQDNLQKLQWHTDAHTAQNGNMGDVNEGASKPIDTNTIAAIETNETNTHIDAAETPLGTDTTQVAEVDIPQMPQVETIQPIPAPEVEQQPQLEPVQEVYYAKHRANIRNAPSSESVVIAGVAKGEMLELLSNQGEWSKIRRQNGAEGYIASRLIDKGSANTQTTHTSNENAAHKELYVVLVDSLNVRAEPDRRSDVVGKLNHNERVYVIDIQGEWAKISLANGRYAYTALRFITKAQ